MQPFKEVLAMAGINPAAFEIGSIKAISKDGRTLAGHGHHAGIGEEAWVARLPEAYLESAQEADP